MQHTYIIETKTKTLHKKQGNLSLEQALALVDFDGDFFLYNHNGIGISGYQYYARKITNVLGQTYTAKNVMHIIAQMRASARIYEILGEKFLHLTDGKKASLSAYIDLLECGSAFF